MYFKKRNNKPDFLKNKGDYTQSSFQNTTYTGNTSPSIQWNQTQSSMKGTAREDFKDVSIVNNIS